MPNSRDAISQAWPKSCEISSDRIERLNGPAEAATCLIQAEEAAAAPSPASIARREIGISSSARLEPSRDRTHLTVEEIIDCTGNVKAWPLAGETRELAHPPWPLLRRAHENVAKSAVVKDIGQTNYV